MKKITGRFNDTMHEWEAYPNTSLEDLAKQNLLLTETELEIVFSLITIPQEHEQYLTE